MGSKHAAPAAAGKDPTKGSEPGVKPEAGREAAEGSSKPQPPSKDPSTSSSRPPLKRDDSSAGKPARPARPSQLDESDPRPAAKPAGSAGSGAAGAKLRPMDPPKRPQQQQDKAERPGAREDKQLGASKVRLAAGRLDGRLAAAPVCLPGRLPARLLPDCVRTLGLWVGARGAAHVRAWHLPWRQALALGPCAHACRLQGKQDKAAPDRPSSSDPTPATLVSKSAAAAAGAGKRPSDSSAIAASHQPAKRLKEAASSAAAATSGGGGAAAGSPAKARAAAGKAASAADAAAAAKALVRERAAAASAAAGAGVGAGSTAIVAQPSVGRAAGASPPAHASAREVDCLLEASLFEDGPVGVVQCRLNLRRLASFRELWEALQARLPAQLLPDRFAARIIYLDAGGDWLMVGPDDRWTTFAAAAERILVCGRP